MSSFPSFCPDETHHHDGSCRGEDLNIRSVAAATALREFVEFIPTSALLCNIAHGVLLQSECQGLHHTVDEDPWRSMFRRFRITCIMASNSLAQVLAWTHMASSRSLAAHHGSNKTFCNHIIGARGFEPPTSWSQTTRSTKLSYAPNRANLLPRSGMFCIRDV